MIILKLAWLVVVLLCSGEARRQARMECDGEDGGAE
jgi:hypothetical protein